MAINRIKRTEITLAGGAAAVISTVELWPGEFETMLASPDFSTEYAVIRSTSEEQALADHKHLRKLHHVPPLSGKYAKLAQDLAAATRYAEQIAATTHDGGTCNFDSCKLYLPGWNAKKVEQAAKAAGVGCFVWNLWGSKSFVFPLRIGAQADARSEAAEAMQKFLASCGYDSGMYYQVD